MASKSSFLPRLSFSRGETPILPFHNPSSPPIRKKPSEYDLSDLSPRPEDRLLAEEPQKLPSSFYDPRSSSLLAPFSDNATSQSKPRPRALFAGPPPPIAASRIIYRDEEDKDASRTPRGRGLDASSFARNLNSVLFDRGSPVRSRDQTKDYEPDAIWRNLQHRERVLQKELQQLLDAQSTGLAAHLDPDAPPSSSARSDASDAGSSTPTDASISHRRRPHVSFEQPTRSTPMGEVIPVRQPRKRPVGLRAARAGLIRNITLLADLKVEEDASLVSALGIRKKALSQLRKLAARRDGITEELQVLESDEAEPLSRELRELGEEHEGVSTEIAELEERLVGLRNRRRWLDGRIEDVKNRREAGLSGYKGALKEVDGRVAAILRKPPVKPLDIEAIACRQGTDTNGTENSSRDGHRNEQVDQSPGGSEFLRMRPERRTIEMARDWWEGEVGILERRKDEVNKERAALEEGVEVWRSAVTLVSDFETGLRREMKGEVSDEAAKGKDAALTPEQAMCAQLDKMAAVMVSLEDYLQAAEERGWNLLICAIGAELEAFQQAEAMLRDALHAAGVNLPATSQQTEQYDGAQSPPLSRLASSTTSGVMRTSFATARSRQSSTLEKLSSSNISRNNSIHDTISSNNNNNASNNTLVDLQEEGGAGENANGGAAGGEGNYKSILDESDNEVPADLLISQPHSPPSRLRQAAQGGGDGYFAPVAGVGAGAQQPPPSPQERRHSQSQSESESPTRSREDSLSENEVPLEFLAELIDDHHHDDIE